MKKVFMFLSSMLICVSCILLVSCSSYSAINDKKIISDKKLLENEWKFTLTVYYNNPNTFFDMPLELGQIRDGEYERSVTQVFYERSFYHFLSEVFTSSPKVTNNKSNKQQGLARKISEYSVKFV